MTTAIATVLLSVAGVGLGFIGLQVYLTRRHLRAPLPQPGPARPGISVLKPLCGFDDDLKRNLESFAELDYPLYEVLLGVRDERDPAYPIACEVARAFPGLMRVVVQQGEPGLNPKVNQLITLVACARHDMLVVSDSNVAVRPGYLLEVAGYLHDPSVGLVAHPVAGCGEHSLGALMDNTHLSALIAPGMVSSLALADFPIVVGKSMALRRSDLRALGGFMSVKDYLAEDFVLGQRIGSELGKQVAIAHRPIAAVSSRRSVRGFFARYLRWATIQRKSVGSLLYAGILVLNPVALACAAALIAPGRATAAALLVCWTIKALLESMAGRALRGRGFSLRGAVAMPLKDALLLLIWLIGLARSRVVWRGNLLSVVEGTRLVPATARFGRLRQAPVSMLLLGSRLFR